MGVKSSSVFTQRVNELMKRNFLTKKEMARRLNIDYSTFWRKLNGQRNVDMALLTQLAEILGTSTSYLTGEIDDVISKPHSSHSNYKINHAYWGEIVDNSLEVAQNGDKEAIAYVSQMLKRALNSLPSVSDAPKEQFTNISVYNGNNSEYIGNTFDTGNLR